MLLDPVEPVGVVIDSHRYFTDVIAHVFHIGAKPLEFGANAVEALCKDADLGLCLLVARRNFGEVGGVLGAHFLQQTDGMVFGLFSHGRDITCTGLYVLRTIHR